MSDNQPAAARRDSPARDPEYQAAEAMAQRFHEAYERLAPGFGYETRKESAVPWDEVPLRNKRLMIAVCRELAARVPDGADERRRLREAVGNWLATIHNWRLSASLSHGDDVGLLTLLKSLRREVLGAGVPPEDTRDSKVETSRNDAAT